MRTRAQGEIPEDLRVYDWTRWVQAAIDAHDGFIAHIPVEERATHWYVVRLIGPSHYRAALTKAVGRRLADHHFYDVLEPCPMGSAPAGWAMPTSEPASDGSLTPVE